MINIPAQKCNSKSKTDFIQIIHKLKWNRSIMREKFNESRDTDFKYLCARVCAHVNCCISVYVFRINQREVSF